MYQLIGTTKLLTTFGITAALVALLYSRISPPSDISELWQMASVSSTIAGALLFLVGQTSLFPAICRWRFVRDHIPPLDGKWVGSFMSNFPKIAEAFEIKGANVGMPIISDFTITARLFHVKISAVSRSPKPGYMRSDTTAFRINRCSMTDRIVIHYVYDAFVGDPDDSDVDRFNGAARLIVLAEGNEIRLEGAYWTDRNWQTGMNTAGTLVLQKDS